MRYPAIYADPPWTWKARSDKGLGRAAQAHYDCMSLEEIKALPIADLVAPDCALFMWTTNPLLPQALEVIQAWGFTYKTVAFCWAKTTKHGKWHIGTGYWSRANAELCLLATRGRPQRLSRAVRMLVPAQVRQHSRKPDEVRQGIMQLVPGPYLELFAREAVPGWAVAFSREAGLFNAGPVKTRRFPSGGSISPPTLL